MPLAGAFVITLREAIEASLVVGIILGYLAKARRTSLARHVWAGVAAAVLASAIAGYLFERFTGGFDGRAEQVFEGVVMLSAAVLLTFMVLWMQKPSRGIKGELQARLDEALGADAALGVAGLAFLSVFREGVEMVLFLKAALVSAPERGVFWGGVAGIAGAIIVAWLLFRSTARLDLRRFFAVTGTMLVLFAAGLVANGLHEFQEAGFLPALVEHLWDTGRWLSADGSLGSFLKSLFGYSASPSLLQVLGWATYLLVFGPRYVRGLTGAARPQSAARS